MWEEKIICNIFLKKHLIGDFLKVIFIKNTSIRNSANRRSKFSLKKKNYNTTIIVTLSSRERKTLVTDFTLYFKVVTAVGGTDFAALENVLG